MSCTKGCLTIEKNQEFKCWLEKSLWVGLKFQYIKQNILKKRPQQTYPFSSINQLSKPIHSQHKLNNYQLTRELLNGQPIICWGMIIWPPKSSS